MISIGLQLSKEALSPHPHDVMQFGLLPLALTTMLRCTACETMCVIL